MGVPKSGARQGGTVRVKARRPALINGVPAPSMGARFLKFIVLGIACALVAIPFLAVLSTSVADPEQLRLAGGYVLWPSSPTWEAYRALLSGGLVTRALLVSIGITVVGTGLALTVQIALAYALSRPGSWGHRPMLMLVLFSLLFSAGIIPNYLLMSALGLIDSYWALILPGVTNAFQIILIRGFFLDVPREITEAAHIDGAGDVTTLTRILLPLSKAGIAVVGLFSAVGFWNAYFNAVLYLNSAEKWPIQLVVRSYVVQSSTLQVTPSPGTPIPPQQSLQMAILVLSLIPIVVVYPFLQRHFTKGVMLGAVKG